jgi:hypothetical protein
MCGHSFHPRHAKSACPGTPLQFAQDPGFPARCSRRVCSCGFPYGKPHTSPWAVPRCRKFGSASVPRHAGTGGMTKLRAVAHLGMSGGGWTESKRAKLDKSDFQPSPRDWSRRGMCTQDYGLLSAVPFDKLPRHAGAGRAGSSGLRGALSFVAGRAILAFTFSVYVYQ